MSDDEVIESLEIDLDIAECGEVLMRYGIEPNPALVVALWEWKQGDRGDE